MATLLKLRLHRSMSTCELTQLIAASVAQALAAKGDNSNLGAEIGQASLMDGEAHASEGLLWDYIKRNHSVLHPDRTFPTVHRSPGSLYNECMPSILADRPEITPSLSMYRPLLDKYQEGPGQRVMLGSHSIDKDFLVSGGPSGKFGSGCRTE